MTNCLIPLSAKEEFQKLFEESIKSTITREIEDLFSALETKNKLFNMIDFLTGEYQKDKPHLLVQPSNVTTDNIIKLPEELINFIRQNIHIVCQTL
jgi:hypothetical protein